MRVYIILISLLVAMSAGSWTATAQMLDYESRTALPEPDWRLITGDDWELEKFQVYARRGHPEGKIRNIMKVYAEPYSGEGLRPRNVINFKRLSKDGKGRLDTFLFKMGNAPLHHVSPREEFAYWLNVRNMLILQALTNESRFKKTKSGRGTPDNPGNVWTEALFSQGGQKYSIQNIERKILKMGKDDPRTLYALYQGSLGGPTLPASGFTPQHLDKQLDVVARHFVGDPVHFDVTEDKIVLPAVYKFYYAELFGDSDVKLRNHLRKYADGMMLEALDRQLPFEYDPMDYQKDSVKEFIKFHKTYSARALFRGTPKVRIDAYGNTQ